MDLKQDGSDNFTEQTLAEQLKITDRDIDERKKLTGFTSEDVAILQTCKPLISENIDAIVDEFYDYQRSIPKIQILIGDAETFRRLHSSMKRYVFELFDGYYDINYVNRRLRIGKVHKSIGVSPKLYVSSLARLESLIAALLISDSQGDVGLIQARLGAFRRLLMLDLQLVFDTYINSLMSEVESAKTEVEEYAETLEVAVSERTRELQNLSRTDELTQLLNQRAFYETLRHEIAVAERGQAVLALLYLDINRFKLLNDKQGHLVGDEVLRKLGQAMVETARTSDTCCRYGGDEFCVIMPNTRWQEACHYADRLQKRFDELITFPVTLSIGFAETGPEIFCYVDTLVKAADDAMYKAKKQSRGSNSHKVCKLVVEN